MQACSFLLRKWIRFKNVSDNHTILLFLGLFRKFPLWLKKFLSITFVVVTEGVGPLYAQGGEDPVQSGSGHHELDEEIVDGNKGLRLDLLDHGQLSEKGDILLIAGKGHEKYQEIKGEKVPFDDKKILSDLLLISI